MQSEGWSAMKSIDQRGLIELGSRQEDKSPLAQYLLLINSFNFHEEEKLI